MMAATELGLSTRNRDRGTLVERILARPGDRVEYEDGRDLPSAFRSQAPSPRTEHAGVAGTPRDICGIRSARCVKTVLWSKLK